MVFYISLLLPPIDDHSMKMLWEWATMISPMSDSNILKVSMKKSFVLPGLPIQGALIRIDFISFLSILKCFFLYVWLNEIFGWSQHEVCLSMVSLRGQYTGLIGSLHYWPQEVFVSGYRTLLRIDVEQQMHFSFLFWHILLVQIYWK